MAHVEQVQPRDSIPRWRTEENPYQAPLPVEFKDEGTLRYEAAIETHERINSELRERIHQLEVENRRLWRENERLKRKLFGPVVFGFHWFGFHMESADLD